MASNQHDTGPCSIRSKDAYSDRIEKPVQQDKQPGVVPLRASQPFACNGTIITIEGLTGLVFTHEVMYNTIVKSGVHTFDAVSLDRSYVATLVHIKILTSHAYSSNSGGYRSKKKDNCSQ